MLSYLEFKVVYLFSELFFHFFSCRMYLPTSLKESLKMDSWKKSFVLLDSVVKRAWQSIHTFVKKKKKKARTSTIQSFTTCFEYVKAKICSADCISVWSHAGECCDRALSNRTRAHASLAYVDMHEHTCTPTHLQARGPPLHTPSLSWWAVLLSRSVVLSPLHSLHTSLLPALNL